ncbi:MAG: metallophosphoesterase family protein, partial [Chloroflexota bacterium]
MRLALISDIHGNFIALETVLAALANERADQILCLGDVAASGPQPRAVIERLRALRIPCVLGNADVELFTLDALTADSDFMRIIKDISVWNAAQLAPADFDFLRAFQPTITVSLGDDVTLLCYHGSPQSNTDIITTTTPDDDLARMVSGVHTTLLAGGHTHTQMLRRYR